MFLEQFEQRTLIYGKYTRTFHFWEICIGWLIQWSSQRLHSVQKVICKKNIYITRKLYLLQCNECDSFNQTNAENSLLSYGQSSLNKVLGESLCVDNNSVSFKHPISPLTLFFKYSDLRIKWLIKVSVEKPGILDLLYSSLHTGCSNNETLLT